MMLRRTSVFLLMAGLGLTQACQASSHKDQGTRYLRFSVDGQEAYGILEGDQVRQLSGDLFGEWEKTETTHALSDVTILVPSKNPSKVLALAGNYKSHIGDSEPNPYPEPFIKLPSSLLAHGGEVVQPADTDPVHYEAEVVIVIGKQARNVSVEAALDHVLGITCGNDISARTWQRNDVQWWRAKAADTFSPTGPYILSGVDYSNLNMVLKVNGEVRQEAKISDMIHGLAESVSFISKYVTLEPGDLIFTGTPGTTKGMQPGDEVTVEIDGVGVLKNKVVAAS
jgi:2-keto-4-pentenoate hydratase/2-oxohepta-3-ene-1,7-dioic acid hydratase in catechol pathway